MANIATLKKLLKKIIMFYLESNFQNKIFQDSK